MSCVHKPLKVSGFSLHVNHGFPIHSCRSIMKRASCVPTISKRGTECIFKVKIKTLHHTKLRLLYKSCYSACIKDNKTYSSLLFFLLFFSDLFKFVVNTEVFSLRELNLLPNIRGQGCKLVKCHKDTSCELPF